MKRLLFFLILIFPFTLYGETTMENFKNSPENRWQFFTDQVMGGRSNGKLDFVSKSGETLHSFKSDFGEMLLLNFLIGNIP